MTYVPANHYECDGNGISGTVDKSSMQRSPAVSLSVDDIPASDVDVDLDGPDVRIRVFLDAVPDAFSRSIELVLPDVNTDDGAAEDFEGYAVITTSRTSVGGVSLVNGAIQRYEIRTVSGTASIVAS